MIDLIEKKSIKMMGFAIIQSLILTVLFLLKNYNYNLFHVFAEGYSIAVALSIFFIVVNSKRYFNNNFLDLLSIGYLFIILIDLLHMLAFKGMNIFAGYDTNLPTQLWIFSRYIESITFLIATILLEKTVKKIAVYGIYLTITFVGLLSIFTGNFPNAFIEGVGLTPFKIVSEYIIISIIAVAFFHLSKKKDKLDKNTFKNLYLSYIFAILTDLMFAFYSDPFDVVNLLGHYFKIFSVYFIYKAVIEVAVKNPQNIIFREIELKKEELERTVQDNIIKLKTVNRSKTALIESMQDLVFVMDNNLIYTECYSSKSNVLYVPPEMILGKHFDDIGFPQPALDIIKGALESTLKTGESRRVDYYLDLPQGRCWFDSQITAIRGEGGKKTGILGVVREITERIKAEEILRQSEERYRSIIAVSNTGAWEYDYDNDCLWCSPEYFMMLGYDPNDFEITNGNLMKNWVGLLHPEDQEQASAVFQQYLSGNGKGMYDHHFRMKRKDGTWAWVWSRGQTLRDENRKPSNITVGTHIDMTEIKEIESKLTESETKFRAISESALDAVILINNEGHIEYWSTSAEKIFGYSRAEMMGKDVHDILIPNHYRARAKKGFETYKQTGQGYAIGKLLELTATHKTGREISIEIALASVVIKEQFWAAAIIRDITERKQMEDSLFIEKEQFKTTLLSVGDGVISTDDQGNIMVMNQIAEKFTGWTQEEAFGKPLEAVFKIIHEFTRETCDNPAQKVLDTGAIMELSNHTMLISKMGQETPIEDSAAPIKDIDGQTTGVVIVFRDFTEKKEKQKQIEYLSFHDHLTGLYNRRYLEDAVKRLDTDRNLPFTIMVLDVNGLKLTNDAFGHDMGDLLLKTVADIMMKVCRTDDIIGRIGGDEFVILLPNTDKAQAESIMERIKDSISKKTLDSVIISLAIGFAVKMSKDQDIENIKKNADKLMYKNKLKYGKTMRNQTIETVLRNINLKYDQEQIHTERVSEYCEAIARSMELSEKEIEHIKTAGALHDIGKIIVPAELLNKLEKLTNEEYEVIRHHPETGYQMLKSVDEYISLAEFVLYHHERWDGKGYPRGLKGEDIPLGARIIAVADAYEAMTAKRSYQRTKNKEEAISELNKCAGTQFDPDIVEVFVEKVLLSASVPSYNNV